MTAEEITAVGSIFCQPGEFAVLQNGKYMFNCNVKHFHDTSRVVEIFTAPNRLLTNSSSINSSVDRWRA